MKKKIKALVIAASVAAIAGVGAVSFAAWSGNHATTDMTGANGSVSLLGFNATTITGFTGLLPYDQIKNGDTAVAPSTTNNTMKTIALSAIVDDGKTYDITVKSSDVGSALIGGGKLYVYVGTSAPSDFSGSASNEWKEVTSSEVTFESFTTTTKPDAYFVLVSGDSQDMNAEYTITFGINEHTATGG